MTAALKISSDVDILLAGYEIQSTVGAEASAINGVKNVIILSNKNISKNITAEDFSHTVISSGSLSGERSVCMCVGEFD